MYLIYEKAWNWVAAGSLEAETVRQKKKDTEMKNKYFVRMSININGVKPPLIFICSNKYKNNGWFLRSLTLGMEAVLRKSSVLLNFKWENSS